MNKNLPDKALEITGVLLLDMGVSEDNPIRVGRSEDKVA